MPGQFSDLEDDFSMNEEHHITRHESPVPRNITIGLLEDSPIPMPFPDTVSGVLEEHLADTILDANNETEVINSFFDSETDILTSARIDFLVEKGKRIQWDKLMSPEKTQSVIQRIVDQLTKLGVESKIIEKILSANVELTDSADSATFAKDEHNITIKLNKLQLLRKAADYVSIYEDGMPLEQIIESLVQLDIGHEIGHVIDMLLNNVSNTIPFEWSTEPNDFENRSERFAEGWGIIGVGENSTEAVVSQKEWIIHLEKSHEMWEALRIRNTRTDKPQIDINKVFSGIDQRLEESPLKDIISARIVTYGGRAFENWVNPYSRTTIVQAIAKYSP